MPENLLEKYNFTLNYKHKKSHLLRVSGWLLSNYILTFLFWGLSYCTQQGVIIGQIVRLNG